MATPGMSYAAAAADPRPKASRASKASDKMTKAMKPAPNKCNNVGGVVTLMTKMQQIMTGIKSAETKDYGSSIILKMVYRSIMLLFSSDRRFQVLSITVGHHLRV
jgi:hypothetical protein